MTTGRGASEATTGVLAPPDRPDLRRATRAVYLAFGGSGFAFASWASRIPQIRDELRVSPATLGLILLAIAGGSLIALPLAGSLVNRFGAARTIMATAGLVGLALVVVGLGYLTGVFPVVVGLFLLGFGNGAWDVGMNVQGAEVERQLGRAIMPRFHAGYSMGTVAGALLGAVMIATGVPVTVHLIGVAVMVVAVVPISTQGFVSDVSEQAAADISAEGGRRSAFAAWKEPRTLLIGLLVLSFAFVEGTGNDWIGIAVIDGYHTGPTLGTLGFALFLTAMTVARWFGPGLLDRFGRVVTLRSLAGLGLAGLLLFVFAPSVPLAYIGVTLWGLGASLGFPVGMSAAADEPRYAASRVSVVASVGYCAFLGGPPLVGFLGDHFGVLRALLVTAGLLALAGTITGAVRPVRD